MKKIVCDRCGHEKPSGATNLYEAWYTNLSQREVADPGIIRDLCPWCQAKFKQFLASYKPGEV